MFIVGLLSGICGLVASITLTNGSNSEGALVFLSICGLPTTFLYWMAPGFAGADWVCILAYFLQYAVLTFLIGKFGKNWHPTNTIMLTIAIVVFLIYFGLKVNLFGI